jgi:hypothetical protein
MKRDDQLLHIFRLDGLTYSIAAIEAAFSTRTCDEYPQAKGLTGQAKF